MGSAGALAGCGIVGCRLLRVIEGPTGWEHVDICREEGLMIERMGAKDKVDGGDRGDRGRRW